MVVFCKLERTNIFPFAIPVYLGKVISCEFHITIYTPAFNMENLKLDIKKNMLIVLKELQYIYCERYKDKRITPMLTCNLSITSFQFLCYAVTSATCLVVCWHSYIASSNFCSNAARHRTICIQPITPDTIA